MEKNFKNSMLQTTIKEWGKLFVRIQNTQCKSKANEIKYKTIHFALPTNLIFKKIGYAADDLCPQSIKPSYTLHHTVCCCEKGLKTFN